MGEVSTEGPLKVYAPVPVEFETALCDATCREGDTLKLKVSLLFEIVISSTFSEISFQVMVSGNFKFTKWG